MARTDMAMVETAEHTISIKIRTQFSLPQVNTQTSRATAKQAMAPRLMDRKKEVAEIPRSTEASRRCLGFWVQSTR